MQNLKLNRRTVLRGIGAGSVAIALPPLEAMLNNHGLFHSAARAQGVDPPKRLFVLHWPQGLPVGWGASDGGFWYPSEEGANYTLTEGLAPLKAHRSDINIVSGLTYEQITEHVGSHGHAVAVFTGYKAKPESPGSPNPLSQGASVDHVAGARIGGATKFASLGAGLYDEDELGFSWSGPGRRAPLKNDPALLFRDLFGNLKPGNADVEARVARRKQSVLNVVKQDIGRLNGVLGAADRARLDEHLTTVRDLERRISTAPAAACSKPGAPTAVTYGDADCGDYSALMLDLLTMALRCDLTRVVFFSLGKSQNYRHFPHLGVTTDYHNIVHGKLRETPEGSARADSWYKAIAKWHMEQVAACLSRLKANDGTGSLLSSTAFVATSEFSSGGLHHNQFMPVIVAGQAARMQTGKNLVYPCDMPEDWQTPAWCGQKSGAQKNICLNSLWTSALRAVGALSPDQAFGDPAASRGGLDGLWA